MEIVEKPWGYEKILEQNDKYVVKLLHVNAGHRLSLQYHEKKLETMYHRKGRGYLELNNEAFRMSDGEVFTIKPGDIHRLVGDSLLALQVIEVSTPELNDVVRLEDDYGR